MTTPTANAKALLPGVSRSFYLSIQLLPAPVREPVALAYLLARATDTVADTPAGTIPQRLGLLERLGMRAQGSPDAALVTDLTAFAAHCTDPHEQALLRQIAPCLNALDHQPAADQTAIRRVLAAITEGQRWDLAALDGPQAGVQTEAELSRYTWLVAGCVGEFWTDVCEGHLHNWRHAEVSELRGWGAQYGMGLQRLNILRDAGRDLRMGRCYWPAETLAPLGLDARRLCRAVAQQDMATLERLLPLTGHWHDTIEAQLHHGLRYSLALRGWRLRLASALPCLIGIHTLTLLRSAGVHALVQHTKLPRAELRRLLLGLLLGGVSDRALQRAWDSAVSTRSARITP